MLLTKRLSSWFCLYLLPLWTVPRFHLHLQRDCLSDAFPLGQTILIWKRKSHNRCFYTKKCLNEQKKKPTSAAGLNNNTWLN